jgi:hypothetical protein
LERGARGGVSLVLGVEDEELGGLLAADQLGGELRAVHVETHGQAARQPRQVREVLPGGDNLTGHGCHCETIPARYRPVVDVARTWLKEQLVESALGKDRPMVRGQLGPSGLHRHLPWVGVRSFADLAVGRVEVVSATTVQGQDVVG